jgi:phosphoribosylpyrophosphate synthetase
VALCRTGDHLHAVLRGYKDAPAVSARRHFARGLAVHLARFLSAHGACIAQAAGSRWDSVAVVPSSARIPAARRPPPLLAGHPLEEVLGSVPPLSGLVQVEIGRGPGSADHLAPEAEAFSVGGEARGRRVLLVDDTWVTGARMQSAAAALVEGGAQVVAMVVAGRAIGAVDTTTAPALERWWRWAEARARGEGEMAYAPCCLVDCVRRPIPPC